jgi:hypothetical protein
MKKRPFQFHFDRNSDMQVRVIVKYRGRSHVVENVLCKVTSFGRTRKTQPRFVMTGACSDVVICGGIALIV